MCAANVYLHKQRALNPTEHVRGSVGPPLESRSGKKVRANVSTVPVMLDINPLI